MCPSKSSLLSVMKWLVVALAYAFLTYKLVNIAHWKELGEGLSRLSAREIGAFAGLLALMPVNWILEAIKWQMLLKDTVVISLKTALKSVLSGINTGYFTPNRIGDFAGRLLFLPPQHRGLGIALSFLNSFTQNLVITVFGAGGALFYFARHYLPIENLHRYFAGIGCGVVAAFMLYFLLPHLIRRLQLKRHGEWLERLVEAASKLTFIRLVQVLSISVVRYFVFCFQFYLALRFFQIAIPFIDALYAIPTMYLLITFTPSFAVSEPAIRGSYAALVLGVFSSGGVGVALAGIGVWLINFVVPMIIGTVIIIRRN